MLHNCHSIWPKVRLNPISSIYQDVMPKPARLLRQFARIAAILPGAVGALEGTPAALNRSPGFGRSSASLGHLRATAAGKERGFCVAIRGGESFAPRSADQPNPEAAAGPWRSAIFRARLPPRQKQRALESVDSVNEEIAGLLKRVWGR